MCSLKLNKPYNYKQYFRKEIKFVYKTFSGVCQQWPQSDTTFLFRVSTFSHNKCSTRSSIAKYPTTTPIFRKTASSQTSTQRSTLTIVRESETPKYCVGLPNYTFLEQDPKSSNIDLLFVRGCSLNDKFTFYPNFVDCYKPRQTLIKYRFSIAMRLGLRIDLPLACRIMIERLSLTRRLFVLKISSVIFSLCLQA